MQVGDVIAGRFRLEAQAGAGGMGVVFRARDLTRAEQTVAIKAWRNDASAQPERFLREAAALAQLREPAVVGHVQHGVSESGEPYLAMEWIEGPTLAERLEGEGLTPLESVALGARVLQGLGALHGAGIVHRDLKPSNLMLPGGDPRAVRILDLGVARLADASELTLAGTRLGTPRYMAPEQIRDPRHVDGRADVFALGCILFECLCGQPAFGGDDPIAVMAQILFGTPPPASELRAELPDALDQLLARLLVRRRELRPPAGPELLAQFAALQAEPLDPRLAGLGAPARLPPSAAMLATIAAAATQPAISFERSSSPALFGRSRRASYAAGDTWPNTPLVGRARELNELCLWLQVERTITLWGGAGVGKTRLAHELSRLAVSRLIVAPEGVLFCELARARDSRDVARMAAEQLGAVAGQADVEEQLGWLFAKLGPMLVVLDRAEHLTRELEPLIRLWTQHAPELRVLVTSRVRLRSTREYQLAPLPHHARGPVLRGPRPPLTAAAELVLTLAGASPRPPELEEQAEAIASALDGNPLAIELALARLPLLGFAGIVERLTGQLNLLAEQSGATTMRRAIAWSWQLLGPAERAAFMQCSVFAGSFSSRAAEAVIVLPAPTGSVLDAVHSLREQSLLGARGEGGAVRLSMPAVVREFAAEQLAEHAERAGAIERHAAYFGALAQQASDAERAAIDPEDLVVAAEHSLGAGADSERALWLVLALEPQLSAAGIGGRWSALLTRVLEAAAERAPDLPLLRARQLRARLLSPAGELQLARRELEGVLAGAERLGDRVLQGTALLDLGVTHHFARELGEARAYYERALDVLCEIDAPVAEARCYGNMGAVDHDQARLQEAAEGYRRALALLPERGEERLVANFESNLALVEHELGRAARARELYASAAARLEGMLDARLLGIALGNFGTLALAERAYSEALEHFLRAAALLEQGGDRRSEGLSLARLGACFALMGRLPEAEQRAVRAERLLRKDALGRAVAALLSGFGDVQAAQRALDDRQLTAAVACSQRAAAKLGAALPLREQSDDLRLYLALLKPQLAELGERLRAAG